MSPPRHKRTLTKKPSAVPSTSGQREAKAILASLRKTEFLHNLKPRVQARLDKYLSDPTKFDKTYAGFTNELLSLLREKMEYADHVLVDLAKRTQWAKDELEQLDEDGRVIYGEARPKNKHKGW